MYIARSNGGVWDRIGDNMPHDVGDIGFAIVPPGQAWFTVYRQAMAVDGTDPLGIYFGTTGGELWGSANSTGCAMNVRLPTMLESYAGGERDVQADGPLPSCCKI